MEESNKFDRNLTSVQEELEKARKELKTLRQEKEIEAGLEKIRQATQTMQQSSELLQVADIMIKEVKDLGIRVIAGGFSILNPDQPEGHQYSSLGKGKFSKPVSIALNEDPNLMKGYRSWKKGEPYFKVDLSGEQLAQHIQNLERILRIQGNKELNRAMDDALYTERAPLTRMIVHHFNFNAGIIYFSCLSPIEEIAVLGRFAKTFELSYTRFLDLEKAEAQAREARIEASLERVRARTMAMHQSHELREVVATIYKEVDTLGICDWGCNLQIYHPEENAIEIWLSEDENKIFDRSFFFRGGEHPKIKLQWDAWRSKQSRFTMSLAGEEKKGYDDYVLEKTDFQYFPEKMKAGILALDQVHFNFSYMTFGYIVGINLASAYTDIEFDVLDRFARVFEQTYTRFIDLQKAEIQAREAQIETALERVRAKTMAMRKSEEVADAASEIYAQLKALGIHPFVCAFILIDEETEAGDLWMTDFNGNVLPNFGKIPSFNGDPYFENILANWKKNEALYSYTLAGKTLRNHDEWALKNTTIPLDEAYKISKKPRLNKQSFLASYFIGIAGGQGN